jgi:hypothetical protein
MNTPEMTSFLSGRNVYFKESFMSGCMEKTHENDSIIPRKLGA